LPREHVLLPAQGAEQSAHLFDGIRRYPSTHSWHLHGHGDDESPRPRLTSPHVRQETVESSPALFTWRARFDAECPRSSRNHIACPHSIAPVCLRELLRMRRACLLSAVGAAAEKTSLRVGLVLNHRKNLFWYHIERVHKLFSHHAHVIHFQIFAAHPAYPLIVGWRLSCVRGMSSSWLGREVLSGTLFTIRGITPFVLAFGSFGGPIQTTGAVSRSCAKSFCKCGACLAPPSSFKYSSFVPRLTKITSGLNSFTAAYKALLSDQLSMRLPCTALDLNST